MQILSLKQTKLVSAGCYRLQQVEIFKIIDYFPYADPEIQRIAEMLRQLLSCSRESVEITQA